MPCRAMGAFASHLSDELSEHARARPGARFLPRQDPQFIAEALKLRQPLSPKSGEEALRVVEEIYAAPDDVVQAARAIVGQ